eukprot:scaffold83726_cov29-Tisochrysis_lutea.AAC.2
MCGCRRVDWLGTRLASERTDEATRRRDPSSLFFFSRPTLLLSSVGLLSPLSPPPPSALPLPLGASTPPSLPSLFFSLPPPRDFEPSSPVAKQTRAAEKKKRGVAQRSRKGQRTALFNISNRE